jgi:hypothetical protein
VIEAKVEAEVELAESDTMADFGIVAQGLQQLQA